MFTDIDEHDRQRDRGTEFCAIANEYCSGGGFLFADLGVEPGERALLNEVRILGSRPAAD